MCFFIFFCIIPKLAVLPFQIREHRLNSARKADDKIFIFKFSKNVKSKLYHIKNSKTKGQTV